MAHHVHHVSIFVSDMNRALNLFKDILGFELIWHIPLAGGRKLSALLGISDLEMELVYLQSQADGTGIELSRLIHPALEMSAVPFGNAGTAGLNILVKDLDGLHRRLTNEGWNPLSPCLSMRSPEGNNIRVFCIRFENSLTLEFIERGGTVV